MRGFFYGVTMDSVTGVKILSAILMVGMLIFIFPRMRAALKNAPKGTSQDWMGFVVPLLAVIGFVVLLILMVKR